MGLFSIPAFQFKAAEQALQTLVDAPEDPAAQSECIARMSPALRQLRDGKVLEQQIHKLLSANNPERALKLLRAAGPGKKFLGIF